MMEFSEIVLRLAAATLIGAAIGLNRDLHGKPTGVRTLGLVCLGSALIVMAGDGFAPTVSAHWDARSRVIQGLITGIGFLGGGVIVRSHAEEMQVRGFTTAACIWLTACIGVVCAIGAWLPIAVTLALVFLLLVLGGPLEKLLHRQLGSSPDE
jgi:putative Mg2+ transporter-C (MgtC) family protein